MRTLSAMVVAAALLLVGVAPASAVTGGFGVSKALRGSPLPVTLSTTPSKKHEVCEIAGARSNGTTGRLVDKFLKRSMPVACEEPPRSIVVTPAQLNAAAVAALKLFG